jgi:phage-related protein
MPTDEKTTRRPLFWEASAKRVRIADRIQVLHAFQKKSKSGIKTPKPDVDLIERRLKAVLKRYRNDDRTR